MKKNKWIYGVILVSLIFTTSSCFFYKTVTVEEVSETTITALAKQKQYVTLQKEGSKGIYILDNYSISDGVLSGTLKQSTQADHPGDKRIFLKSRGKLAKSYLHLYTAAPLTAGTIEIPISNISGMETHANEFAASLLATTGIIAAVAVVGTVAFLAIACSCPHVATINPDGSSHFQGSLFPGSIFKSLKRKDYVVLNNVEPNIDGLITVQVFNDLDEVQYIDQVELFEVQHSQSHLGLIQNVDLMAYNLGQFPISAQTHIKRDVLVELRDRDNKNYDFTDPAIEDVLNSIEFSFNTSNLEKDALLVIRGQQTELLEHTAEVFFQQFGTKFPAWVEKMNNADPSNYNQNSIDQGIALNAYVKKNDEWEYIGSYENVGAMAQRDLAIPVDLSAVKSEIKIKLEAVYGFWSIDQVTLTSDWTTELKMESLELVTAVNQNDNDVMKSLSKTDEDYLVQALKGTSTNLKFKSMGCSKSTFVLSGSGYYNHERNYNTSPNYKFLKKMKRMKYSTHELAQMVQLYEDIHLADNN